MKYFGGTDRGIRRTNQDSYVIATNENGDVFALICDGIGGGRGGDVASQMAVSRFSVAFAATGAFADQYALKNWIRTRVSEVNRVIFDAGNERPSLKGMGTTLCGVLITSVGTFIVNIGDSRCYTYSHRSGFRQITRDHSLVNDMLLHGEITKEEAENYPQKNVLTNALGVWETVRCDIETFNEKNDGFLICSDGLHGYVDEDVIAGIVLNTKTDPARRTRKLIEAALDAGGYDNVTVILIDLEDSAV
ncbi:MAG: Stp1/IreP family PP2C-type Ser/Thr phosphatase [Solobacterium sp.]|nr:Stp1/IreP family PP2C-type Ser/Thr phosphatase [Solobacterium sp.]